MSENEKRNKRKTLFVSRTVQGRVMWHVGIYWVVYHFLLWHVLFLAEGIVGIKAMSFGDRYARFCSEHVMLAVCAMAILPIVLLDMMRLTHRIVGPFARLERALSEMSQRKKVPKLQLRENDLVHDFVIAFNGFVEHHNRTIQSEISSVESSGPSAITQVEPTTC
jgi:hypothetical protein